MYGKAVLLSVSLLAQTTFADDRPCQSSVDANPNVLVPVFVTKHREVSTHPASIMRFDRYEIKLGRNNEFDLTCVTHRNAVMLFVLQDSNYQFLDIRFYENGKPSEQMVQTEIHDDYVRVVNLNDSAVAAEVTIKYTLVLKDKRNGTVINLDPVVINKPPT